MKTRNRTKDTHTHTKLCKNKQTLSCYEGGANMIVTKGRPFSFSTNLQGYNFFTITIIPHLFCFGIFLLSKEIRINSFFCFSLQRTITFNEHRTIFHKLQHHRTRLFFFLKRTIRLYISYTPNEGKDWNCHKACIIFCKLFLSLLIMKIIPTISSFIFSFRGHHQRDMPRGRGSI